MLRALVLSLALANLGFYAWTQGWLDALLGSPGQGEREPERLARQVRPEVVRLLPAHAGSSVAAAAVDAAASEPAAVPSGPSAAQQ